MTEEFFTEKLPNGLTLLGQRMPHVASAAMTLAVPCGSSCDPAGIEGAASIAAEWCLRGAGDRDTHRLNDALDSLGCQHDENVLSESTRFSAALLGRNLGDLLALVADIVRRPRLAYESFAPCRDLILQDLLSLEDEPAQKCNLMLRERFYPYPLGRCVYGTEDSLAAAEPEAVRRHVQDGFVPDGSILAVAGDIDWAEVRDRAEKEFGDWTGRRRDSLPLRPGEGGVVHIPKDSAQVHIALAQRSVTASNGLYYAARVAETVLSGGMSGRLFTEVREKRGLVYHVSCRYHSLKNYAGMFTYAGTTPPKAQETLDVTVGELRRLAEGVCPDELARARTQLKSGLVMQGESTAARAAALAADWFHLGRLRSLEEISEAIDRVTAEDVVAYLQAYPAENFTLLIVGPDGLDVRGLEGGAP